MVAIKKSNCNINELCVLMEVCDKHDVASLQMGDIKIVFGKASRDRDKRDASTVITPTVEEMAVINQEANRQFLKDELETKEDRIEQMILEDPLGAESMIADGDLENDDQPTDESGNGD